MPEGFMPYLTRINSFGLTGMIALGFFWQKITVSTFPEAIRKNYGVFWY